MPTAEQEVERLTKVLDDIAHSWSNDADFLRNMAARAIFENGDGCDINDTLANLESMLTDDNLQDSKSAVDTAIAIVSGLDSKYLLPNVYAGVKGRITLTWEKDEDTTIMIIVGDKLIELYKTHVQKTSVHMSPRSYTSGNLPPDMLKYIPFRENQCE